jgi:hypothetical protein
LAKRGSSNYSGFEWRRPYESLFRLGKDAGARGPKVLAQQLLLLINSTQATAGMLGRSTQWAIVGAAETLLRAQGIELCHTALK